jgi:Domain of unknown function (DUF5069)
MHIPGLRSDREMVDGLVFFGRMLDKIRLHSLTLTATLRPSRDKLRGIGPVANEKPRHAPKPTPEQVTRQGSYLTT